MTRTSRPLGALACLLAGLRAAAGRPGLLAAIWGWHLVIGLAVAIPIFRWLYDTTAYRPAADAIADRFSFGLLAELTQADGGSPVGLVLNAFTGGLLLAVVTAPFLLAAALASLRDATLRGRDAGSAATSLYWPFFRVLVFGRAVALAAALATAAALRPALRWLSEGPWEPGLLWALGVRAGAAAVVAVLLFAAVDFALVRLEVDRSRRAFRAWLAGLRFAAVSRIGLTLALWTGAAVFLAVMLALFVALDEFASRGGRSLPAIAGAAAIALQQAFMLGRTWLRLGLLGAEQQAFEAACQVARMDPVPEPVPSIEPAEAAASQQAVAGEGTSTEEP
jgi:hypothetical protein